MGKVVLFDVDGVVVNKPRQFSQCFSAEFGVPVADILPFFEDEFQLCLVGKADLKEVIKPYLEKWGWKKSVEELLEYWFECENYIDERVVGLIKAWRAKGIKCYMQSNQEKYRTEYMKNKMGLGQVADGIFSSAYLGARKPAEEFWQKVFDEIQPAQKEDVLVLDDDQENIESAKKFGFEAELYTGFENLEAKF